MKKHIKAEYLTFQYLTLPQVSCDVEKEENVGNETDLAIDREIHFMIFYLPLKYHDMKLRHNET